MRLICDRGQLHGEYGTVVLGQEFEVSEDVGRELLRSGVARKPEPPRILYETKVITPEAPQVSPRQPFRHLPVSHQEQAAVAAPSDPVLPEADVPQPGITDPQRRGRRTRSGTAK